MAFGQPEAVVDGQRLCGVGVCEGRTTGVEGRTSTDDGQVSAKGLLREVRHDFRCGQNRPGERGGDTIQERLLELVVNL